jgi:hypothetical protein
VPLKQRVGSHEVFVRSWSSTDTREGAGRIQVTIVLGESPSEEEHIAFQSLLFAVQRLQWLTRELSYKHHV